MSTLAVGPWRSFSQIPWENIYHIGMVVSDLEARMGELSTQLGITWTTIRSLRIATTGADRREEADLRVAFSVNGPPFLEVLQSGSPHSVWPNTGYDGIHHIGILVEDVAGETARLEAAGLRREAASFGGSDDDMRFSYLVGPAGLRIELVHRRGGEGIREWVEAAIADGSGQ